MMHRVLLALPNVALGLYSMNTATLHMSLVSAAQAAAHVAADQRSVYPAVPGARMLEITWQMLLSTVMSDVKTLGCSRTLDVQVGAL